MTRLNDKYYDAIVINDDIDPNRAGAVRVKILGVTDTLDVKNQPFAIPAVSSQQAVPTKGTNLSVLFDEGDVHLVKYYLASSQKNALPKEYVDNYPNVSVSNLGADDFQMVHNRESKTTDIIHSSGMNMNWDSDGKITLDTQSAFDNTGYRANTGNGTRLHAVLTEAYIDIFTCMPVGRGKIGQGSDYLVIPQSMKSNISNLMDNQDEEIFSVDEPTTGDNYVDLIDITGNITGQVEFIEVKSMIKLNERDINRIYIVNSSNDDFGLTANGFMNNSGISTHYLIGTSERSDIGSGFAQFVSLTNQCMFDGSLESDVIIMLIGVDAYTDYQYTILKKVIDHVKANQSDENIKIEVINSIGNIDLTRI